LEYRIKNPNQKIDIQMVENEDNIFESNLNEDHLLLNEKGLPNYNSDYNTPINKFVINKIKKINDKSKFKSIHLSLRKVRISHFNLKKFRGVMESTDKDKLKIKFNRTDI